MRIDFYELSGRFTDPLFVAGVLVGRAWPGTASVVIVAAHDQLEQLDKRLWNEPEGRFLPHAIGPSNAPIRLLEQAPERADILINLDSASPLPDGRFERILELVPPDEGLKERLRERWKAWRQRGADVHHHVLK